MVTVACRWPCGILSNAISGGEHGVQGLLRDFPRSHIDGQQSVNRFVHIDSLLRILQARMVWRAGLEYPMRRRNKGCVYACSHKGSHWPCTKGEQTRISINGVLFVEPQYGDHLTKPKDPAYSNPQEVASLRVSAHIQSS